MGVLRVNKLKCETGGIERKNGSDRKRASTIVEDRYLKWLCRQNRHASAPYLKVEENTCGININARTVQRRLKECDLLA